MVSNNVYNVNLIHSAPFISDQCRSLTINRSEIKFIFRNSNLNIWTREREIHACRFSLFVDERSDSQSVVRLWATVVIEGT